MPRDTRKNARPLSPDWINNTQRLIKQAETAGNLSSNLRDQSAAAKKTVDKETEKHHTQVNDQLRKKVQETQSLVMKLQQRISGCADETAKLTHYKRAAQKMLDDREGPIRLTEKRERVRARMPNRERINDNVERALDKELSDLRDACQQLANIINQAADQLNRLNHQHQLLQADLTDKAHALQLDQQCLEVQNHPDKDRHALKTTMGSRPRMEMADSRQLMQKSTTAPDVWKKGTSQLVEECLALEQGSEKIRSNIQRIMRLLEASNSQSSTHVQNCLKNKVKQSSNLQVQLMKKLQEVNQEMDHLQEEKQQLISTLQAKIGPLKVVRDRLGIRNSRPERETIRDSVEEALEAELARLKITVNTLEQKLDHVEIEQKRLHHLKKQLEADLSDKSVALRLDRRCLELDLDQLSARSSVPPSSPQYQSGGMAPRPPSSGTMSVRSARSVSSGGSLPQLSPRR